MNGYSKELQKVILNAQELARKSGGLMGTEQVISAMLNTEESKGGQLLRNFGVNPKEYQSISINMDHASESYKASARVQQALQAACKRAISLKAEYLYSDLLLFEILKDTSSYGVKALIQLGTNLNAVYSSLASKFSPENKSLEDELMGLFGNLDDDDNNEDILSQIFNEPVDDQDSSFGDTDSKNNDSSLKGLEKFGVDLTRKAREGKLDPVIGRKNETDRIIQTLSRKTKNNPVLIGEPGVGKSAIVDGLAQAIVAGDVPEMLKDKTIFSLDLTSMLAGTKYRGEFEERIKKMLDALKQNPNVILFIDEIHMIVGAGESEGGSMDAANMLKPQLARGEIQTIGATTITEYRKFIEKDPALERRFQPIMVDPPSTEDALCILKGVRKKYEDHHKVKITDEALKAAVNLSDRYITDRFLPDKALDLIDEAAAAKHVGASVMPKDISEYEDKIAKISLDINGAVSRRDFAKADQLENERKKMQQEYNNLKAKWKTSKSNEDLVLTEEDIAKVVSAWTKVPVVKLTQSEADVLLNLENVLRKRVVGQDEAVTAVAKAVRRARVGIKDPKRPIGTFIFLGPTGVGKTELSKALAEAMFGDENSIIRIDMSEYMDAANVSKLIGSAPGYVGYDEGGQLTEKVRRNPYSVVLFDEIEKAHPDVFNILLQILDDGRLTDSHGRTINFKNTIIILTSNIGAGEIKKGSLGFGDAKSTISYEEMKEREMDALKRTLKPEFINRIDDIIVFRSFEKADMNSIAKLMGNNLINRLKERNLTVEITDAAYDVIIEKGFNSEYGARPLKRALQSMVEDELATKMLKNEFGLGDTVVVDAKDGALTFAKKEVKKEESSGDAPSDNKSE